MTCKTSSHGSDNQASHSITSGSNRISNSAAHASDSSRQPESTSISARPSNHGTCSAKNPAAVAQPATLTLPWNDCSYTSQACMPRTWQLPSTASEYRLLPPTHQGNTSPESAIEHGGHPAACTPPSDCTCRSPSMSAIQLPAAHSEALATTSITPEASIRKAIRSMPLPPKVAGPPASSAWDTHRDSSFPQNLACHPIFPVPSTCEDKTDAEHP